MSSGSRDSQPDVLPPQGLAEDKAPPDRGLASQLWQSWFFSSLRGIATAGEQN